jgi:MYXO-CTERM domain-containing protein
LLLWSASATAQSINVTPSTIPVPSQGVPYSVTFVASDGVAPYQFLVSTGMLPAGLSLSAGGALTGTPTTSGAYSFTITVSDALGRELDLTGAGTVAGGLTITPPPVLVINTPYSGQIQVTGGTGPYTFAINSGTLPPGMSLSASGMLTGTPTAPGNYAVVIQVTDANGLSSTLTLNISVMASATGIPVNEPWMLALAALGLGWLGRRQLRKRH